LIEKAPVNKGLIFGRMPMKKSTLFGICLFLMLSLGRIMALADVVEEKVVATYPNGAKKTVNVHHGEIKLKEEQYRQDGTKSLEKDYLWEEYPFGIWHKYSPGEKEIASGNFIIGNNEEIFINRIFEGAYRENYKNGHPKTRATFHGGFLRGKWTRYYPNGNVDLEGTIVDGKSMINTKSYSEKGDILSADMLVTPYRYYWSYYESGGIQREDVYNGDRRILFREYFQNARVKREIIEPSNNLRHTSYFYETGVLERLETHRDGLMDGIFVSYFQDGSLKSSGQFLKGHNFGKWLIYYEKGDILKQISFVDLGSITDDYVEYFPNGSVKIRAHFKNGELDGAYYQYDEAGNVIFSIPSVEEGRKYIFRVFHSGADMFELKVTKK
jgi:antitoxin component YwqK of YwqJK toxin-antitoxin module